MRQYDLHVLCADCGQFHDASHRVWLAESFDVRIVSDLYAMQPPDEFYKAIAQIICPRTGEPVRQTRPDMMVLVAEGK
jgi:hypothetical protein